MSDALTDAILSFRNKFDARSDQMLSAVKHLAACVRKEIHGAVGSVNEALGILSQRIDALEAGNLTDALRAEMRVQAHSVTNALMFPAKPQAAETRRNPYEDFVVGYASHTRWNRNELQALLTTAWNKGAQSVEEANAEIARLKALLATHQGENDQAWVYQRDLAAHRGRELEIVEGKLTDIEAELCLRDNACRHCAPIRAIIDKPHHEADPDPWLVVYNGPDKHGNQVTGFIDIEELPENLQPFYIEQERRRRALVDLTNADAPQGDDSITISRADARTLAEFDVRKFQRQGEPPIYREPTEEFRMAVSRIRKQLHPASGGTD